MLTVLLSMAAASSLWMTCGRSCAAASTATSPSEVLPQISRRLATTLPLEMRVAGVKLADLPAEVTQIQGTPDAIDIEFATLPGHADGPGIGKGR